MLELGTGIHSLLNGCFSEAGLFSGELKQVQMTLVWGSKRESRRCRSHRLFMCLREHFSASCDTLVSGNTHRVDLLSWRRDTIPGGVEHARDFYDQILLLLAVTPWFPLKCVSVEEFDPS